MSDYEICLKIKFTQTDKLDRRFLGIPQLNLIFEVSYITNIDVIEQMATG